MCTTTLLTVSALLLSSAVLADDPADPARLPAPPAGSLGFPSRAPDLDAYPGFVNPPPGYGQVPYWWWQGDKLTRERIGWQLDQLHAKGVGGLQVNLAHDTVGTPHYGPTYPTDPPLFSKEWWEIWRWTVAECGKRNMPIGLSDYTLAWAGHGYWTDEIRANPDLQGATLGVQQLRAEGGRALNAKLAENTVSVVGYRSGAGGLDGESAVDLRERVKDGQLAWTPPAGSWQVLAVAWRRNANSIDPMNPEVGRQVVAKWFQPFEDHTPGLAGKGLNYFFSDELTFGVGGNLWTPRLPAEFARRKGYDLLGVLPALFVDIGPRTPKIRLDYYDVTTALTEEGYFRPTFDWQWQRGMIYACDPGSRGRNPREFGDYFRANRWYSAPGHDTPGLGADLIKGKVSSSIAHLYQRPRVWLEGYHSSGWGTGLAQITDATRRNLLYGCTLVNLHGLYYTTHGGHWEWAPPCFHFRMPYWDHMGAWFKYFERLSYLLSQGVHRCDVAILYPVAPAEAGLSGDEARECAFGLGGELYQQGLDFDYIDFESVARAKVADRLLQVAGEAYRVLVLPHMRAVRWSTLAQALAFYRAGGTVVAWGVLPEASDRAGRADPQLDAAVKEIFGLTAAEAAAGQTVPPQRNAAGGVGAFLGPQQAVPAAAEEPKSGLRRYDGGFEGRWVWASEARPRVSFKAVWRGGRGTFAAKLCGDNHATLFVNGKQAAHTDSYTDGWTGQLALADGDVLTIDGRDDDPEGRLTAGVFFAVVKGGATVLGPEDLVYHLTPGADWRTSADLTGLRRASTANVHPAHQGQGAGARPAASPQRGARVKAVIDAAVPRDFVAPGPANVLHRKIGPRDIYYVMGVPRGTECFFHARGKVELWDPATGRATPVTACTPTPEGTKVRLPLDANDATLLVFSPGDPGPSVEATDLDEVLAVEGRTLRGLSATGGAKTATVRFGAETVTLRGEAPTTPEPLTITGEWESELQPTLDNRFGDFRQPPTPALIGAEARTFRYQEETAPNPGWQAPDCDDTRWPTVLCGYGLQYYQLGPVPPSVDAATLEAALLGMTQVDPTRPVTLGDARLSWRPAEFSWRYGVWDDPGEQGYHGLKEKLTDQFLCLGQKRVAAYNTSYGPEQSLPTGRYYLWTTALARQAGEATLLQGGKAPAAVWVNGQRVAGDKAAVQAGANRLLLRYDGPGRGYCLLDTGAPQATPRTPLAMTWWDRPGVLPWDPRPGGSGVGWYRFTAPPGLRRLTVTACGQVRVWVDGQALAAAPVGPSPARRDGAAVSVWSLPQAIPQAAKIALRIAGTAGRLGGAALPEPIALDCGLGRTTLGDWSKLGVLANYSGGLWYRQTVELTPARLAGRVYLDLGAVAATAGVRVNGQSAAVLYAPPWRAEIGRWAKPGANRLEVLVYSTLANHYQTIPSRYRGNPLAGLLGPVTISTVPEVVLR